MAKSVASVAGGLHSLYGPTLTGMGAPVNLGEHRYAQQNLAHKGDFEYRSLVDTLLGVAPGATATKTYAEISASAELGGARPIVVSNIVNRATTAQDVADIKKTLTTMSVNTFNPTPVFNGDRNPLGTR